MMHEDDDNAKYLTYELALIGAGSVVAVLLLGYVFWQLVYG